MFIFSNKKFNNPSEIILAFNQKEVIEAFKKIQALKDKFYLVGYVTYNAFEKNVISKKPLVYFEAHKTFENFEVESSNKKSNIYIKENITFDRYKKDISKIKNHISNGSTYEVNYTFSNDIYSDTNGFELYQNIIQNQKTPYCAYVNNEYDEILSFSPELFFEIKNNKIYTKPMKGTVKRKGNDKEEISFLKNDIKNKAENVMIVDLIRNDSAKIKASKNISVTKLFEVETHKTLHQMTSTITADLCEVDYFDIFSCLFPCGSITGAPKISTMEIIKKIENYQRRIYCGAIGLITKESALFNVAIRTLEKTDKKDKKYIFCQGGAIVWKSETKDEWLECKTKRAFLGNSTEFNLIETMVTKNNKTLYFNEHIKRLKESSKKLGFKFNNNLLKESFKNNKIVRISLAKDGSYQLEYREIRPVSSNKIEISKEKVNSKNSFLYFKTDFCPWYQASRRKIKQGEIFDTIFLNEKEELTEGSISNIILKKDGVLYTPDLNSGLLKGIYLTQLIKNRKVKTKKLYLEDLYSADNIYMINSVKGTVEVSL